MASIERPTAQPEKIMGGRISNDIGTFTGELRQVTRPPTRQRTRDESSPCAAETASHGNNLPEAADR
jgi:hypothetical protein